MKIPKNSRAPLSYLSERPHPLAAEFVTHFLRATHGDEESMQRTVLIAKLSYDVCRNPNTHATKEDIAETNAFMHCANHLASEWMAAEEPAAQATPVAEPPDAAHK
jgi:hypothetical protein